MPFFKKREKNPDKSTALVEIKSALQKIDNSVKKKEKEIHLLKQKAMQALGQKNEKLARIHLAKKLHAEQQIEKLYNISRKLTDQADAIEEAETMTIATEALKGAVNVLNNYARIIEELNVEDIIAESEESMAIIEDASDLMSDNTLDILDEEEITGQLEALQAEIALEMGNQLALAPGVSAGEEGLEEAGHDDATAEISSMNLADSEQVKRELEKLRKELDLG